MNPGFSEDEKARIKHHVCEQLGSRTLLSICNDSGIPTRETIYQWLAGDKAFADKYAKARTVQADHFADDILKITDAPIVLPSDDTAKSSVLLKAEMERRRQQIDARKWHASKTAPKKYGERIIQNQEIEIKTSAKPLSYKQAAELSDEEKTIYLATGVLPEQEAGPESPKA